jgi:predicted AAA+ superfamily ATPase
MELVPRFLPIPERSFFLFGPRGTGKTTWLEHRFPEALSINLLRPEVYREMSARPERLSELVAGVKGPTVVIVDEVQRVPELLNVVHDLIERRPGCRFMLTGSSARKLRRGWPGARSSAPSILSWRPNCGSFAWSQLWKWGCCHWCWPLRTRPRS